MSYRPVVDRRPEDDPAQHEADDDGGGPEQPRHDPGVAGCEVRPSVERAGLAVATEGGRKPRERTHYTNGTINTTDWGRLIITWAGEPYVRTVWLGDCGRDIRNIWC